MPKIDTDMIDEVESPDVGVVYKIKEIEEFTSAVRNFKGYRVVMEDTEGKEVTETLWKQAVSSPNSKLGAYVSKLGKDTDDWKGKLIKYTVWQRGNRNVQVMPPEE